MYKQIIYNPAANGRQKFKNKIIAVLLVDSIEMKCLSVGGFELQSGFC